MKSDLLNLALASEAVTELAYAAARGELSSPQRLHDAMFAYARIANGYLGAGDVADFIRAEGDRYDLGVTKAAIDRVAQRVEVQFADLAAIN